MDVKAISLMVQTKEPNDTWKEERKQKVWCNQCMRKDMEGSSYKDNDGDDVKRSYDNNSYVRKEKSRRYKLEGAYMNVEGKAAEYDEGLEIKNDVAGPWQL